MISERQQEQASLYALGALSPSEARTFESEFSGDPELAGLVRELQSVMTLVAAATPAPPPPPALKERILRQVDELESGRNASPPTPRPPPRPLPAGLSFLTAVDQGGWKELPVPGTYIKLVSLERDRGYAVLLGKLDPGARYPAHRNVGAEDFYILTGDLVVGDRAMGAGDFHHADAGSEHEENYSVTGCTLLAVLTTDDPLVAFAMA
jgi:anti-sigma factor ChrR (cupin superfamily)